MNKYQRKIKGVEIDIYDILRAYEVKSHAVGHAVKKLLMAGKRGAKPYEQDLWEAVISVERERDDYLDARNASVKHESDDGWWLEHKGNVCPVPLYEFVSIKLRDGTIRDRVKADSLNWASAITTQFNIVAYKVLK